MLSEPAVPREPSRPPAGSSPAGFEGLTTPPSREPAPETDSGEIHQEDLFRREALAHHVRGYREQGDVLHLSPRWTPWAFRLLVAAFVAAGLFLALAPIDEYAVGTFVVVREGRTEVSAAVPGTVVSVAVRPGEPVAAGQVLARLYDAPEAAELARVRRELEAALIQRLRDPGDPSTERPLAGLRAQEELAEARLEERSLRSPVDGRVHDVHARPGRPVMPGEAVVSVVDERADMSVLVALPGHYRPLVRPGRPLRLELDGYRYAYQKLVVERVGDELYGPAEARRYLGPDAADALTLAGPVIFVHARLPSAEFTSDGRVHSFHDGMRGRAEIPVRSEGVLSGLFPGLKLLSSSP